MRVLAKSVRDNYLAGTGGDAYLDTGDMVFVGQAAGAEEAIAAMPDADVIFADAIAPVDAALIEGLPSLRLIQSEGVAYNMIDLDAARERGVFVCNNAGGNAPAVAEQAVLLMLGLLRNVVENDAAVREGRQFEAKGAAFREGIDDLGDCTVGIIGMGAIGQEIARRLKGFGARVVYSSRRRRGRELEEELGMEYCASRGELLAQADIVSLNCAVVPETERMADESFFAQMKPGARLVNTARGELIDNAALAQALESGRLGGAGLDTVAPEPVTADNPLLNLSPEASARVLFSPHVGGITTGSRRRMQAHMWRNLAAVERGERPTCIVNGL